MPYKIHFIGQADHEGLYLEHPFDEREVRDSECLVYTASQPFGAGFFVCLSPPTRVGTNHYVAGWYLGTYRTPGSQPSYLSPGSAPAYL